MAYIFKKNKKKYYLLNNSKFFNLQTYEWIEQGKYSSFIVQFSHGVFKRVVCSFELLSTVLARSTVDNNLDYSSTFDQLSVAGH